MLLLRKSLKRRYIRQVIVYFLTCCLLFNTSVALAAENPVPTALPSGFNEATSSGVVVNDPIGSSLTIDQTLPAAIANWQNFDIGTDASVHFNQLSTDAVLNRVWDGDVTGIMGTLTGDGRVFIVNPAGVIFGAGATVNVNQLVASALDIDDLDFQNGIYNFVVPGIGEVANHGEIIANEGVALLGKNVQNTGTIVTEPGGFVVMAAGDSVWLSPQGSKIVVEMSSATGDDVGNVINERIDGSRPGIIEAPEGTIVLAAGDIYSIPLHPQLQDSSLGAIENREYDYTDDSPGGDKEVIDLQPVRVETGTGSVQQLGDIQADGAAGEVILTGGDEVVLGETSTTSSVGGKVITYAYDFGDKGATTYFNDGAEVAVGTGLAGINGNHVLFAGDVLASPGATIQVDPITLTIADVMPGTGPVLDTLYEEEHVEFYSQAGVNLDLAADDMITVEYMLDSDVVGEISGGSGDIYLRNVFDNGGIYFEQEDEAGHTGPRTTIRTTAFYESDDVYRDGGSIYMDAGFGGIVAGDLFTDTENNDKMSQPGEIVLRTTKGGDIEVGTMRAEGATSTQVSAISGGNLTVHGDGESINKQVDNELQTVSKAILCLIAEEDVILNGENYEVYSHGKFETTADVRISAGGNVYIATDPDTGEATGDATITAQAKTSEQKDVTKSTAYIVIHAGRTLYDDEGNPVPSPEGEIIINGQTYSPGVAYLTKGDIVAKAWPDLQQGVDSSDSPDSTVGTKTVWYKSTDDPDNFFVKIEINSNEAVPIDEGPCQDCPTPPGLPPVPPIFWIVDDAETVSWSDVLVALDVLANDGPKADYVSFNTAAGGTLVPVIDTDPMSPTYGEIIGFQYTPPTGVTFTWDGVNGYATYTDSFTYKAKNEDGTESINTATVTITVTNYLPTAAGDSAIVHMDDPAIFELADGGLITDSDGTPTWGALDLSVIDPTFGDSSLSSPTATADATYTPFEGFVGTDDFDYTVTDSTIIYPETPQNATATLTVTVENTLPGGAVTLEDAHMDASGETLSVVSGDFTDADDDFAITSITAATGDENKTFGGSLAYNGSDDPYVSGDTYDYTADGTIPGYVGEDDFDVQLWDGEFEYQQSQTSPGIEW
ncbi:MAG: two-partner secretion domain-containing protein, partial [Planctomycetota bacterium]